MYMGPLEASKPWNTNDTVGLYRFLQRAWRLVVDEETGALKLRETPDAAVEKQLHRTIAKVGADIEKLAFNTAIAAMIELVNLATGSGGLTRDQLDRFARILSPFAPHMGEELWHRLGHGGSVAHAEWPSHDAAQLRDDEVEIVVQILGKVRAKLMAPAEADAAALEAIALADPRVRELLEGKTVRKVIAVPGRLVNIVAN
jgi:leucyl-tRNA synthetase